MSFKFQIDEKIQKLLQHFDLLGQYWVYDDACLEGIALISQSMDNQKDFDSFIRKLPLQLLSKVKPYDGIYTLMLPKSEFDSALSIFEDQRLESKNCEIPCDFNWKAFQATMNYLDRGSNDSSSNFSKVYADVELRPEGLYVKLKDWYKDWPKSEFPEEMFKEHGLQLEGDMFIISTDMMRVLESYAEDIFPSVFPTGNVLRKKLCGYLKGWQFAEIKKMDCKDRYVALGNVVLGEMAESCVGCEERVNKWFRKKGIECEVERSGRYVVVKDPEKIYRGFWLKNRKVE